MPMVRTPNLIPPNIKAPNISETLTLEEAITHPNWSARKITKQ
jgi:hypothetical protein